MKSRYYISAIAGLALAISSCVEDEGSYKMLPVNEVNVSGLESSYPVTAGVTQLQIEPAIEGTLSGTDDSQYEYSWYACDPELGADIHEHTVLGTEKNLNTIVHLDPGTYSLYFIVTDKSTGLEWVFQSTLNVQTALSKGFYVFGDKDDGTVGIDFLSMLEGEDSVIVKDIFVNEQGIKGAEDMIFSGSSYSPNGQNLWAVTNTGTYKITSLISESSLFYVDPDYNEDLCFFPTLNVQRPLKIVDQFPHQLSGGGMAGRNRGYITEDAVFVGSFTMGESYGNPVNRYDATSTTLFKPYKTAFYKNAYSNDAIMFYDTDAGCFSIIRGVYGGWTYEEKCDKLTDKTDNPFPWNQTDRTIVYGENSSGYSHALMKDLIQSGRYYIYEMDVEYSPSKIACYQLNADNAPGLDEAAYYACFSRQPVMLYSVGTKLYGINYRFESNRAVMLKDFGSEITHLAFDAVSRGRDTDLVICTYDNTNKGTIYKYEINDNPNTNGEISPIEKCEWKTDLKVKKLEYRNCTF